MKKVGILTFHRAHNYGAVLQCYALQETLIKLGYDACVIDYRNNYIEKMYIPFSLEVFKERLASHNLINILRYIKKTPQRVRLYYTYTRFSKKYLRLSTSPIYDVVPLKDIDIYMVGSDQMWIYNKSNGEPNRFYFGDFTCQGGSKLVSYAISSNELSIKLLGKDRLTQYANNFSVLSFREQKIRKLVQEMTNVESRLDIDPTLLAKNSIWDPLINDKWKDKRYVLTYFLRCPHYNKELIRKAKVIAKQLNCELIDLSSCRFSPTEFVSLFKYAQYVVTTSFHGTAFSLVFEKQFYSVKLNDGHDERYVDLLQKIGATDMLVDLDFSPRIQTVGYEKIRQKIYELSSDSMQYLTNIVNL